MTKVPVVPAGTAMEQVNVPDTDEVSEPELQAVTATASNSREATGEETENPLPETVTGDPTGPCPGVTVRVGEVTVKLPVAERSSMPNAVTMVPTVPLGTAKEHENAPELFAVREPEEQLVTVTLSKTSEVSAVDGENTVPVIVTAEPTGP
jgi:hypothetical protein